MANIVEMRRSAQEITHKLCECLGIEKEDTMPSSFWNDDMVMLTDENLPFGMRVYGTWNEYADRTRGRWFWHAPTRVFRLPLEDQFLLAQKNDNRMVYDKRDKKIRHFHGRVLVNSYENILEAVQVN